MGKSYQGGGECCQLTERGWLSSTIMYMHSRVIMCFNLLYSSFMLLVSPVYLQRIRGQSSTTEWTRNWCRCLTSNINWPQRIIHKPTGWTKDSTRPCQTLWPSLHRTTVLPSFSTLTKIHNFHPHLHPRMCQNVPGQLVQCINNDRRNAALTSMMSLSMLTHTNTKSLLNAAKAGFLS